MHRIMRSFRTINVISLIGTIARKCFRNPIQRFRLKNKKVSIISQNCIGGVMSHDLGLPFRSPMINLYCRWPDYLLFLENLRYCCVQELLFVKSEKEYPRACIQTPDHNLIYLYFPHEHNIVKIRDEWNRRKARINWDNIAIIATDRDGLNSDCLNRFQKLPYKKILLSCRINGEPFVQYYPKFRKMEQVPSMVEIHSLTGKRDYEYGWDYISWLNEH